LSRVDIRRSLTSLRIDLVNRSFPAIFLRAEGLVLGGAAIALYLEGDYRLWPLLAFFLLPDVSMLAYLAGTRAGAAAYNVAHTSVFPLALAAAGVIAGGDLAVQIALVWAAHIGVDRLLGYGLKYPTAFKDTHLQRI
jgi:hypothetical protein